MAVELSMRERKLARAAQNAASFTQNVNQNDIVTNSYAEPKRTAEEKEKGIFRHLEPAIKITANTFDSAFNAKLLTSSDFETMIADLFRPISNQYYGCSVNFINNTQVDIIVYFTERREPLGPGQFSIIEKKNSRRNMNSSELAYAYSNRGGMKNVDQCYVITKAGADIMIPFIDINKYCKGDVKDLNINWGNRDLKFERINQDNTNISMPMASRFIVVGIRLDANRLLQALYGKKDEAGNRMYYSIIKGTPIVENISGVRFQGNNYIVQINQMNSGVIEKMYKIASNSGNAGNVLGINTK